MNSVVGDFRFYPLIRLESFKIVSQDDLISNIKIINNAEIKIDTIHYTNIGGI